MHHKETTADTLIGQCQVEAQKLFLAVRAADRCLANHDKHLQAAQERIEDHDKRIQTLELKLVEIESAVTLGEDLDVLCGESTVVTVQEALRNLICKAAYEQDVMPQILWDYLYASYSKKHGIDLVARAKNAKLSVCEYAEQVNVIDKLYALALLLYNTEE